MKNFSRTLLVFAAKETTVIVALGSRPGDDSVSSKTTLSSTSMAQSDATPTIDAGPDDSVAVERREHWKE